MPVSMVRSLGVAEASHTDFDWNSEPSFGTISQFAARCNAEPRSTPNHGARRRGTLRDRCPAKLSDAKLGPQYPDYRPASAQNPKCRSFWIAKRYCARSLPIGKLPPACADSLPDRSVRSSEQEQGAMDPRRAGPCRGHPERPLHKSSSVRRGERDRNGPVRPACPAWRRPARQCRLPKSPDVQPAAVPARPRPWHGPPRRLDGADLPEQHPRHAEQFGFRLIGIGDEAAFDDIGRPGDVGQGASDQPAGAGLGRSHSPAAGAAHIEQPCRSGLDLIFRHRSPSQQAQREPEQSCGIERGQHIVEHDAEPALDPAIGQPAGQGLKISAARNNRKPSP